jgi:hypothetical protein
MVHCVKEEKLPKQLAKTKESGSGKDTLLTVKLLTTVAVAATMAETRLTMLHDRRALRT